MAKKTFIEANHASDFLDVLRDNDDLHLCINGVQEVIVKDIHISVGPGNKVSNAICDIVYPSTGICENDVPLYRIKAYRYDFKEGDYAAGHNGKLFIIGKIADVKVGLHAVLDDDGIIIMDGNDMNYGKWILGGLHPCKGWEEHALNYELLRIGKRFNKESKQIESVN